LQNASFAEQRKLLTYRTERESVECGTQSYGEVGVVNNDSERTLNESRV